MKVKFSELSDVSPAKLRSYRGLFSDLSLNSLKRKYDFDANGDPITLSKPIKLNTLVVNIKNSEGKVKEKVFDFVGNKLVISNWTKRELTPELIKSIQRIGEQIFKENSHFNVVINSNEIQVDGNSCYIENSNGAKVHGNGCFVKDKPGAVVGVKESHLNIQPANIPFVRKYVTASQLYAYDTCPHRVWRDANLLQEQIDPANEFLQLLWEKGILYEAKVLSNLIDGTYLDLKEGSKEERFENTLEAMRHKVPLIYQGVLIVDELFAEPDLLQLLPDGNYVPIDIKAAMGTEQSESSVNEEGKYKPHYAMQLCLYADALIRLGFAKERKGIIFDIGGKNTLYDLNSPKNTKDKRAWWEIYETNKEEVLALIQNRKRNDPALKSECKLCHWLSSCTKWCEDNNDLSLIYKLGRAFKESMIQDTDIKTIYDLANINVEALLKEKEAADGGFLKGIGENALINFARRAQYRISGASGVKILNPIQFPQKNIELFFDIEADPTQDFVYLHGVYERRDGKTRYLSFVASDSDKASEEKAWRDFWNYIRELPKTDYAVYHYGVYEKVIYNKLKEKYPNVVSQEELNNFFNPERCVDLYRVVDRNTDWPLKSYSIKSIAQLIGFKWRDPHPSGAASIQWYNTYLTTKEPDGLKRILEYNEDDCKATLVLKDYLIEENKKQTDQKISLPIV